MDTTKNDRIVRKTNDYSIFKLSEKNRVLNVFKHKRLDESFKTCGFMKCYPIVVKRVGEKYVIYDGQHRWFFAKKYQTPVYYVEVNNNYDENDIAKVNNTQKRWEFKDYAESYEKQGKAEYANLIEFHKTYNIPIHVSVALLRGNSDNGGSGTSQYINGDFKVKEMSFAIKAAEIMNATTTNPLFKCSKNTRFVRAIAGCLMVESFNVERMIERIKACPEKLINYSTKDDFLNMMEAIYNHKMRSGKWFPLALEVRKKDQERTIIKYKK